MNMRLTCLAGGVGAARFLQGLVRIVPPRNLTIVVNTGDDFQFCKLHVSPDLDIVMYTLVGIVDEGKGWGIRGDTFNTLEMLANYGCETWFRLGDKDFATSIYRTSLLAQGLTLSEVTDKLCRLLGLEVKIIPMTNHTVETKVQTAFGTIGFQEYLVKRKAEPRVLDVFLGGAEEAEPAPGILEAIHDSDGVIICPSNPIVSIGTILTVREVKEAISKTRAKVLSISPIVGGAPIKGPADKLMRAKGVEVSAYGVAELYKDFLDIFIVDNLDRDLKSQIEGLGVKVIISSTIMKDLDDKVRLAELCLRAIG